MWWLYNHDFTYVCLYVQPYSRKCCETHESEDNTLMENGRDAHYCLVIHIVYHQEWLILWSKQFMYIKYNNSVPNSQYKHHFQEQPLMLLMEIIPVYSANRTIMRQLLAHLHQFSICDIQDASPDSQNMEVTWCGVRAVWWMFKTLPSILLQLGCHL